MLRHLLGFAVACQLLSVSFPASACPMVFGLDLQDIKSADAVLIGRVERYRIIPNPGAKYFQDKTSYMPVNTSRYNFAQFDVVVDQVLSGKTAGRLSIFWKVSTFDDPDIMIGKPFLIALQEMKAVNRTADAALGIVRPRYAARSWTILVPPCTPAFVMPANGATVLEARKILKTRP